jgi:hypothetical protein
MKKLKTATLLTLFSLSMIGCQAETPPPATDSVAAGIDVDRSTPMVSSAGTQAIGKPGAPVEISYEVIGNPIVGVPVSINVVVTSSAGPLQVHYSINDQSALIFQDGQVERLEIIDPGAGSLQQITVVPQREGRLYINVSAEIQAPMGTMIRSMAIPIKVGRAPASLPVNGEVKHGSDGEVVVSMPATSSN